MTHHVQQNFLHAVGIMLEHQSILFHYTIFALGRSFAKIIPRAKEKISTKAVVLLGKRNNMGEAKRRKKLNSNYGQNDFKLKFLSEEESDTVARKVLKDFAAKLNRKYYYVQLITQ